MKLLAFEDTVRIGAGRLDDIPLRSTLTTIDVTNEEVHENDDRIVALNAVPQHPLGVRPSGNQYTATENSRLFMGFFQILPDEFLQGLLDYLTVDASLLLSLGSTCRALYAFCSAEDLWKTILINSIDDNRTFKWSGTWRSTYLNLTSERRVSISCVNLFSDALYRPYLCAHTNLTPYTTSIPIKNEISRLEDMTAEEFTAKWCEKPFILTKPTKEWPAYRTWDISSLQSRYGSIAFRQESVDWRLTDYVEYMTNTSDESPLYLFDRDFVAKMNLTVGRDQKDAAYWIPDCFGEDLFSVLGTQRPDSRWLIIGPERSGSTFHKDPNATSAWNAVLRGSKYWIMFPSSAAYPPPPGVYVSADQSEVTSPLSIAEWLMGYHAEARRTPGCVEGICGEGEVLHVPSGWWHLVINLEPSIALTQNFVPRAHLPSVLSFLRDKPEQVSGFRKEVKNPFDAFVEGMRRDHPDLLAEAEFVLEKSYTVTAKKRKWDVAVGIEKEKGGFSFGFGADSDED